MAAFDEQVMERRDLPEYGLEPRCANPRCPNRADDAHEIYPRSQAVGVVWWLELPGRYLLGNRIGLCRGCHASNDAHDTQILWYPEDERFYWIDFGERWADPLEPMPPVHKLSDESAVVSGLAQTGEQISQRGEPDQQAPDSVEVPVPSAAEPEIDYLGPDPNDQMAGERWGEPEIPPIPASVIDEPDVVHEDELARRVAATKAYVDSLSLRDVDAGPFGADEPPQDVLELHEPVGSSLPVAGLAEFVETNVPLGHELVEPGIEPLEVDVVQPKVPREQGSDERTLAAAREATEQAQRVARGTIETIPELGTRYRADLVIDPESFETEILAGDMRAKVLVDALAAQAKRAPKPRTRKTPPTDSGEREPAKVRKLWGIHVPAEARDEGKIELGEDGASILDDALELARERIGMYEADHVGWKYETITQVLHWFCTNYTPEGED